MIHRISICIISIAIIDAYRILGVFPFNTKSHNILFGALMKSLAKYGHQVDVISHYPLKTPLENYYDIITLIEPLKEFNDIKFDRLYQKPFDVSELAKVFGNRICHFMGHRSMQKLIRNPPIDPPYDLVITEAIFANCYIGLGYVFNTPVVAVTSGMEFPWINYFTGNTGNLAYVPNSLYPDAGPMNLYGRIKNVLMNYVEIWKFQRATEKSQTDSMRKYLSADMPNIREVEKSVALTLVNTHPTLFGIKPVTPSVIQIGGLHIEANDEILPTDLKDWLDNSTLGVVYFSLGSLILIESLPSNILLDVYATFKNISPIRVLMKVSNHSKLLPGLPENVKTLSWIPQQAVLAHPYIKLFITHGGIGGLQEAIYYGVPMIALPLYNDQFQNVDNLVAKGIAIRINFNEFSEKVLGAALNAILYNTTYKEKAGFYSKLFRDQPMNSTSKAIFWIEYVIRNGADVLRSPAIRLSFMQLTLLDVYGILLIGILFIFLVFLLCVKIVSRATLKYLSTRIVVRKNGYKKHSNKII